ncbi:hypothetical protein BGZ76_008837, partial [Entomortierella beljakovae]
IYYGPAPIDPPEDIPDIIEDVFEQPLIEMLTPNLRQQLEQSRAARQEEEQRERAIKQEALERAQEAAKRKREEKLAEEFEECEKDLRELWVKMGIAVFGSLRNMTMDNDNIIQESKKRKCTIEYFKGAVALMKQTTREVIGINEVGAGRRCQ